MIIDNSISAEPENKPLQHTVKDLDADDQPRIKAARLGCTALSTADLWALILRTGTPGNPITSLARDLMRFNGGKLHTLERRTRKELMTIKGIGITKALQIEAVLELMRRYNSETSGDNPIISSSQDIFRIMAPKIGNIPHEEMWAIMLNRRNEVVKLFQISVGSGVATIFDLKKLLKAALLENTCGIILCHNHPSGGNRPSKQDDDVTRRCKAGCEAMDIKFFDHLIICADTYFSYADNQRL